MNVWLHATQELTGPAVLVTVAAIEGSSPREAGAKMVVTADQQFDTIGGGHVELRACEIARELLDDGVARKVERFALGPSLGQCCGGVMYLLFEIIDAPLTSMLSALRKRWLLRKDSWRVIALDGEVTGALLDQDYAIVEGALKQSPVQIDKRRTCSITQDEDGRRWLVDACLAYRPHLVLFGAGHVGAALVRTLGELPCHITWVDERESQFPATVPANVTVEATDTPDVIARTAPAGSCFIVMTHSHALDQELCEIVLHRPDHAWLGLIGSKTKRKQFEHRLAERGVLAQRLNAMVCPIGVPGITSKFPAVIAASVAAQLLQVWEAQERAALQPPLRVMSAHR